MDMRAMQKVYLALERARIIENPKNLELKTIPGSLNHCRMKKRWQTLIDWLAKEVNFTWDTRVYQDGEIKVWDAFFDDLRELFAAVKIVLGLK